MADEENIIAEGDEHRSQPARDLSQKVIKKLRVREFPPNPKKKSLPARETLVPKTIQFEGTKFDGLKEAHRFEFNRGP